MGHVPVDHVAEALHYAHEVVAGGIPACKWVKAACQRQLDDLARWEFDPDYPFDWRPELAARRIRFIELLRHVKGKWGGERISLHPAQKFGIACVFGWVRKSDGLRRFRTVYEETPRKNAKTTKLAAIGLSMLVADDEWGAEVYSAATTRDQAHIVFDIGSQMARMDGEFRGRFGIEVLTRSIIVRDTASKFVPLSAEGSTLDGLNVSCALIDELHAHKTRAVHDVLDSATGSRGQPLIWKITTAGWNRAGVCYDQRAYLTKILNATLKRHGGMGYPVEGEAVEDDAFWGIIYTIDKDDDPLDEATWRKANPLYGISVDPEDMRRMATVAKVQAQALNEFLTKRLNVWVNADSAWMNMLRWDACADRSINIEQFKGEPCWVGLDAAFKKDLFAKMRVFRSGKYYCFGRYYIPEAQAQARGNEHFAAWVREGWIRTTPGDVLDIEAVREELLEDTRNFEVREIPFDPAQLTQFATECVSGGLPMVEMRPTVLNFSPAMKELDELVSGGKLVHTGDPVLAWAIANVVCHRDKKDNIYPNKETPEQKIDPAIALIMALGRAMVGQDEVFNPYNDRDMVFL
jgi:phage terminase large subunit-like protein